MSYLTLPSPTLRRLNLSSPHLTSLCLNISYTIKLHIMTYITLHYMLRYITLHYITLPTLHYLTLYITLRYVTLHYITLHYITLHYITLHYITLQYIILHECIATLPSVILQYIICEYFGNRRKNKDKMLVQESLHSFLYKKEHFSQRFTQIAPIV